MGKFHVKCQKLILDMKFPHFYKLTYSGSIGEFSCQMPEAQFRHEISPLLKTNKRQFKWGNFMADARLPEVYSFLT